MPFKSAASDLVFSKGALYNGCPRLTSFGFPPAWLTVLNCPCNLSFDQVNLRSSCSRKWEPVFTSALLGVSQHFSYWLMLSRTLLSPFFFLANLQVPSPCSILDVINIAAFPSPILSFLAAKAVFNNSSLFCLNYCNFILASLLPSDSIYPRCCS